MNYLLVSIKRKPAPEYWVQDLGGQQFSTERASCAVFSEQCTVHRVLTIINHLDVMNRLGRAMADPTRSRILLMLLEGPNHPAVMSRELGLSRSNVSNHLACLRDCGIVVAEPEGRKTRYEIADPHLTRALTALLETTLAVDQGASCIDPACSVPTRCKMEAGA